MVRDDIGVLELESVERRKVFTEIPDPGRQWLRGVDLACPLENLPQQGQRGRLLVTVARLVVEIPKEDTLVLSEGGENILHIYAQVFVERHGILSQAHRRVAHPAGVVNTDLWLRLLAVARLSVPAVVEEDEERPDAVTVADREEVVHALLQSLRVMLVDDAAEEDAHGLEAELLSPSELFVDLRMVVRVLAPHLYLVDGCGGNIVAAGEPGQLRIPGIGFGLRPSRAHGCFHPLLGRGRHHAQAGQEQNGQDR